MELGEFGQKLVNVPIGVIAIAALASVALQGVSDSIYPVIIAVFAVLSIATLVSVTSWFIK